MAHPDPSPDPPQSLTLRDAYLFFFPLIFMAEMMMISHSVIHAFLARMPDPRTTLAAYNVAFSFHSIAGAPIWTAVMTSLAFIGDRRSAVRLVIFHLWVAGVIFVVGYAFALTSLGDILFSRLMGASPLVAHEAKRALLVFMLVPPVTIFRALCYALLMKNRRTVLITIGTSIRLIALAGFLVVLPKIFSGATVGAAALLACISVETVLALIISRRELAALPDVREGHNSDYAEMWRFAWPLMLVQASENGVAFTINFFLGRLARPDLALASFGVMDGLWKLMLSSLRNLAQTAQALVQTREDRQCVLHFTFQVVAIFVALTGLLYFSPARRFVLDAVMGLTAELSEATGPSLLFFPVMAVVLGYSAVFRGLLLGVRISKPVALSAGVRLVVVMLVGGLALVMPGMSGAVLGILTLIAAFGSEALVLGWRVRRPGRTVWPSAVDTASP